MTNQEIRNLDVEELIDSILETEEELQKLLIAHSVAQLDNPLVIKTLRRQKARLKTELHRRTLKEVEQKIKNKDCTLKNIGYFLKNNDFLTELKRGKIKQMIKDMS